MLTSAFKNQLSKGGHRRIFFSYQALFFAYVNLLNAMHYAKTNFLPVLERIKKGKKTVKDIFTEEETNVGNVLYFAAREYCFLTLTVREGEKIGENCEVSLVDSNLTAQVLKSQYETISKDVFKLLHEICTAMGSLEVSNKKRIKKKKRNVNIIKK